MSKIFNQAPIVFSGQEVDLTFVPQASGTCVVTFTAMGGPNGHGRGFGYDFLAKNGFSALHVRSFRNHWYQPAEIRTAIDVARQKIAEFGYHDIVVYGASMGAYGAAAYSKLIGATRGILIAPQYSIDTAKMPAEKRWRQEASEIDFIYDNLDEQISQTAEIYLLADPISEDRPHINLYLNHKNVNLIPVPFGGHVPGKLLVETNLMSEVILSLIRGKFAKSDFSKRMNSFRRNSSSYWLEISRVASKQGRINLAIYANDEALKRSKNSIGLMHQKFHLLLRSGELDKALRLAMDTIEMDKTHPASWRNLSVVALRGGNLDLALSASTTAVQYRPKDADLHRVRLMALTRAQRWHEALEVASKAVELDPNYAQTYADLSQIYLALGDKEKAIQSLQFAIKLDQTKEKWRSDMRLLS